MSSMYPPSGGRGNGQDNSEDNIPMSSPSDYYDYTSSGQSQAPFGQDYRAQSYAQQAPQQPYPQQAPQQPYPQQASGAYGVPPNQPMPKKGNGAAIGCVIAIVITLLLITIPVALFFYYFDKEIDSYTESKEVSVGGPGVSSGGESRDDTLPIGAWVESGEWRVSLDSVDLDANREIHDENEFNDPPKAGYVYVMAGLTVTYLGDDPQGDNPFVEVEWTNPDGTTFDDSDASVVIDDRFYSTGKTLYKGGTYTGKIVFEVPSATVDDSTIAIKPTISSEKRFFSVK
ncbi:DUF4352 domain-containing protein [Corynebacterium aquatimens]|uniref:DUF4352 domain-containing protein n=1 Tax=Corynebacterium aquatimens TaxID=1190508 RepID=A0A931E2P8_9CORY|nr:DUF4352 domain-containing protein [Corynebacterium aquatimens]MBG6122485.1 hypothetical protein [Corynebacterium aquatimens]WJY64975.1 Telomeric repeat-binding factor 2 [Corynebacterium aquatimens]